MLLIFTYLQCFTSLVGAIIQYGYLSLITTLIAVACSQFDKLKAAIQDIRQQHITSHHRQEHEQVHTTVNCDLQYKLNLSIQHHQDIIE
jgi:hypothetical protein